MALERGAPRRHRSRRLSDQGSGSDGSVLVLTSPGEPVYDSYLAIAPNGALGDSGSVHRGPKRFGSSDPIEIARDGEVAQRFDGRRKKTGWDSR